MFWNEDGIVRTVKLAPFAIPFKAILENERERALGRKREKRDTVFERECEREKGRKRESITRVEKKEEH